MYPVKANSLRTLMVKLLGYFGVFCLKGTVRLKETILSSTARYSEVL
jgi:hypothetical protein